MRHSRRERYASARHIRIIGWAAAGLIALAVLGLVVFDTAENPLCATRSVRALVQSELARMGETDIAELAHSNHLSEAMVLDAFPRVRRTGVPADELPVVWNWLRQWPDPVVTLHHGRQFWQVRGLLPELRRVMERGDWGFGDAGDAFSGRVPVSEIGAIYAYTAGSGDAATVTVVFLDRSGEILFRIAPHDAAVAAAPGQDERASETFRRMQALPQACDKVT